MIVRLNSIDIGSGVSEFRLFRAGANETTKGTFTFDAKAAKSVMAEYQKHGVDIMIDLEHLSLDTESSSYDPDAVGWCKLELRGGELWAVNVKWTPDGQRRLSDKRQRYISPAFATDEKGRVTRILNVALTALPATDEAMELVAASIRKQSAVHAAQNRSQTNMNENDAKLAAQLLAALKQLSEGAESDQLKAWIASAMESLSAAVSGEEPAAEAPAGEDAQPEEEQKVAASGRNSSAIVELAEARKQAAALASEVARLRAESAIGEKERLIAANQDKFSPALEGWARSLDLPALKAFLSAAPKIVRSEMTEPERKAPVVTLSDDEKYVAKFFGRSEEQVLKFKAAELAAGKGQ